MDVLATNKWSLSLSLSLSLEKVDVPPTQKQRNLKRENESFLIAA